MDYQIHYFGFCQPRERTLFLPEDGLFDVDIIDTWNMTVTSAGIHKGTTHIELPGRQYMAVRVRRHICSAWVKQKADEKPGSWI